MENIDNLVSSLHNNYDVSTFDGLRRLAEDHGIQVIETDRVVVETTFHREGVGYNIFIGRSHFPEVRRWALAHELGHVLRDSSNELEPDYFARSLVGPSPSPVQTLSTVFFRLVTNPLRCLRYLLDFGYRYGGYDEDLMEIARNIKQ